MTRKSRRDDGRGIPLDSGAAAPDQTVAVPDKVEADGVEAEAGRLGDGGPSLLPAPSPAGESPLRVAATCGGAIAAVAGFAKLASLAAPMPTVAVLLAFAAGLVVALSFQGSRAGAAAKRAADLADSAAPIGVAPDSAVEAALMAARDEAEAASTAKSRVLAVASHEIRTPLNGILGMAGLLQRSGLTAEQESYVKAVETSGNALLVLIDDLLDFSRIEAGRIDLEPAPAALGDEMESLVELLATRAAAKGIELAIYVDPALPAAVVVDMPRLRQVLFNLVGNGIKFTAEGGVAIELTRDTEAETGDGRMAVRFQVRDTGVGIDAADLERIFREFEQANGGSARSHGGTGLGLAIAQRLVGLMGGTITVESAPGAGACFSFTILLEPASSAAIAEPPLAGRHILIVSHALIEAPLMLRRLFDGGADVNLVTQSGLERGLIEAREPVDAVIVDAALGDPVAVLDRVRAVSDAPAGILLAATERDHLARYLHAGFAAYLVKPVRSASLARIVARLIDGGGFDAPPRRQPIRRGFRTGGRVLLCDDNEINLLIGRSLLESLGYTVAVAADGRRAVALFRSALRTEEGFDTVLLDLHMPEMDGFEAARRIRQLESEVAAPRSRIVAVTADTLPETRARCSAEPFDGWVPKPLEADAIESAVSAAA
jgi:signal transduction histidine kinase/DNA-binding response OmpR family regulator